MAWGSTSNLGGWPPESSPYDWVTTVLTGTAASVTITPPTFGTHLELECSVRSDTTGVSVGSAGIYVNGDTTTGNYHTQWSSAVNGAAASAEATTRVFAQHPTADCVAGYFGSISIRFPFFRRTDRQKLWFAEWGHETAALNQTYGSGVSKRQTAGVGALTDAITSVQIFPAANNWDIGALFRYRVVS